MAKITQNHDRIHSDLYDKVNACTVAVNKLTTELKTLKSSMKTETDRYVELLHRAQDKQSRAVCGLILTIIFCVGIIGYGAIGQRGMYTVRNTLPTGQNITPDWHIIPPDNQDVYPHTEKAKTK